MKIKKLVLTTLAVVMLSTPAFAATDGVLGSTSTGTADISVSIPELILISGMADVALGAYSGTGDLSGNEDICIYTNKATGTYLVTGTGDGGVFEITDGTNTIPYSTFYNDSAGTTGEVQLTSGTPSGQQSGADTTSLNCSGGNNANYHVVLAEADLQAAPAGSYSGTLTLVVEPN